MRKKIIFLLNSIVPKCGTNKIVVDIVNEVCRSNDVKILSIEGQECPYPLLKNIEIISIYGRKKIINKKNSNFWKDYYNIRFSKNRVINTVFMFYKFPCFFKILKRENPFAIISFLPRANLINILLKKFFNFNYKVIICERNFNSIQYNKSIFEKFFLKIMKIFYKEANVVVTNSIEMKKDLSLNFGIIEEKIKVIYNPFNLKKIEELSNEKINEISLNPNVPLILNVGRLIEQKNQKLLIKAFSKVREKLQCKLIILSEGELEGELKKLTEELKIQEDVYFLGWQNNPYKFMKRANVFVLSSNFEGFPNVLVEAMACGCPVISTNCPTGPSEILENGEYGILVPIGNETALAASIIELLKNEELRKKLSEKAKERAKDFDIKKIVPFFEQLWN